MPAQGNRGSPPIQGGNDGKQQVFLDPYRIYIDYADSDLSYDEVTEDGIKGREIRRRRKRAGFTPLFCLREKITIETDDESRAEDAALEAKWTRRNSSLCESWVEKIASNSLCAVRSFE